MNVMKVMSSSETAANLVICCFVAFVAVLFSAAVFLVHRSAGIDEAQWVGLVRAALFVGFTYVAIGIERAIRRLRA